MFDIRSAISPPIGSAVLEKIFVERPLLKDILDQHGKKSLKEFFRDSLQHLPQPPVERKQEFIDVVAAVVKDVCGDASAEGLRTQLDRYYGASTADHHGTLNSSLALNANMLLSEAYHALNDEVATVVPVLSCASVTLNNEDYPRGIMFHSSSNGRFELQKLSLLPSNSHNSLVYNFRPYRAEEVEKVEKVVNEKRRAGELTDVEADSVLSMLSSVYRRPEILAARSVSDQFTLINIHLWRSLFHGNEKKNDLLYIPLEEVATQLLIKHHLEAQTPLYRLLFDPTATDISTQLQTVMETYLRQGALATHFFWGISDKNYRVPLRLVDGSLVSADGLLSIPYTPESVRTALTEKRLMPNLFVAYTLIHLYYGFNCIGGFNQIHYLHAMRAEYNRSGLDPVPSQANSQLFGYGFEHIFMKGTTAPATGLDVYLHGNTQSSDALRTDLTSITVKDGLQGVFSIVSNMLGFSQ